MPLDDPYVYAKCECHVQHSPLAIQKVSDLIWCEPGRVGLTGRVDAPGWYIEFTSVEDTEWYGPVNYCPHCGTDVREMRP